MRENPIESSGESVTVIPVTYQGLRALHFESTITHARLVTASEFRNTVGEDGISRPNAIYFLGDTVYLEELARMRERFHIPHAILNVGAAAVVPPGGEGGGSRCSSPWTGGRRCGCSGQTV
ncbi:hypothetical protein PG994_014511 [Apiospora phragmitis]|uniref:Uncharacterized protein n=1 Tax=Apiospora phragmitis TaxID=2905665 RepID=A0ABR1T4L1_9PEZI